MNTIERCCVVQAITTKWIGPTNTRGSRVKASCAAGTITVPWDHALNPEQNHRKVAEQLRDKLAWEWPMVQGSIDHLHGSGYCFVLVRPESR